MLDAVGCCLVAGECTAQLSFRKASGQAKHSWCAACFKASGIPLLIASHPPNRALPSDAPLALQEGRWSEALASIPLVAVKPSTTFREAIANLIDHNKHR